MTGEDITSLNMWWTKNPLLHPLTWAWIHLLILCQKDFLRKFFAASWNSGILVKTPEYLFKKITTIVIYYNIYPTMSLTFLQICIRTTKNTLQHPQICINLLIQRWGFSETFLQYYCNLKREIVKVVHILIFVDVLIDQKSN